MKKTYALLNLLVLIAVIFWNYVANAQGINENSVGSLSAEYANLFTPAGYAFSIWGIIYIALVCNAVYLLTLAFKKPGDDVISKMGPWLIIANIGNAAWIWFWLTEQTAMSVVVMLVVLVSLLRLVLKLGLGTSSASRGTRNWVWGPISLYSGWITVATVANISAYLAKIEWQALLTEVTWTVVMMSIATFIYVFVLLRRNMRIYTGVGVWALIAIANRHWDNIQIIQWFGLACAAILTLGIIFSAAKSYRLDRITNQARASLNT